ncbi:MAG: hypothetical protein EBZ48_10695 [Proteobacteria bacterium]|nr:hypothetical protein [Pseudomonadota bacterium]
MRPAFTALRQATVLYRPGVFQYIIPLQADACGCKALKQVSFAIPEAALERIQASATAQELFLKGTLSAAELGEPLLASPESWSSLVSETKLR